MTLRPRRPSCQGRPGVFLAAAGDGGRHDAPTAPTRGHDRTRAPGGASALRPPMNFHVAIQHAALKSGPKAVCWALLGAADWSTGAGIRASVGTIAAGAGLKPSATRTALKTLEALGIVVFERRTRGGSGREVHQVRLDLPALHRLAVSDGTLSPPESGAGPSGIWSGPLQVLASNTPETERNQNCSKLPPTRFVAAGPMPRPCRPVAEPIGPRSGVEDSRRALAAEGVALSVASKLAEQCSVEEIRAGVDWVNLHARTAKSRAGVLVCRLRDGTAKRALEARQAKEQTASIRELCASRRRSITALRHRSEFGPAGADHSTRVAWRVIDTAWATDQDIAAARVVPDERLFASPPDDRALLRSLVRRARAELERRSGIAYGLGSGDMHASGVTPGS